MAVYLKVDLKNVSLRPFINARKMKLHFGQPA